MNLRMIFRLKEKSAFIKDWFSEKVNKCDATSCNLNFGTCSSNSICKCKIGYASAPSYTNGIACSYEQKKQLTAFLLEIFIMGAGHLYRGAVLVGILKIFFIVLFPFVLLCLVFMGIIIDSDIKTQNCFLISSIVVFGLYTLSIIIWYFYDIINFGINSYTDGNGIPLLHW